MTGPEFRTALEAVGMKPAAFGAFIGVNRATVFRWLADELPVPLYARRVLELLGERRRLAADLAGPPRT